MKKKMWNKKISDMLSEFAEGVKNKTYKKIPYDVWRELRTHSEDYGTIEIEFAFANPYEEDKTRVFLKNQKGQELYTSYIMDSSFGTYLFDLYQKWRAEELKKSTERMKESFNQIAATANSATADLTISSQALQDCYTRTDGIMLYGEPVPAWSVYDRGNAVLEVNEDSFKINGKTIQELIQEVIDNNIEEKRKVEDKTMNKMFGNIEFGNCEKDNVRMSPYGLAVQNQSGTWVAYDKATDSIIDVEILNFDGGKYLFKMPVALKDVAAGDVIIHGRTPVIVDLIDDTGRVVCVDPRAGEEKIVIPTKNMFGFNFVTKIVNMFENMLGTPNADQPFGNMLPLMFADSDSDMLPLALMMTQGGQTANFNPLMFYALSQNKGGNDNLLPLMLMMNPNGFKA